MIIKSIFILFIVFIKFSYGNTIIDLANTQLDSNEHIIHDLTQQEIIEGELSQERALQRWYPK